MVIPRTLAFVVLLALTLLGLGQGVPIQPTRDPAAKINIGDVLTINVAGAEQYGGEVTVLSDGSINGRFGRLVVKDKTLEQATAMIVTALKKYIIDPEVTVSIKTQRVEVVYVLSARATESGVFPLAPEMDLRQLVALVKFEEDPDQLDATLSRKGQPPIEINLPKLLRGGNDDDNVKLEPNDLLTILPKAYVRIWVTGLVSKPGELRIPQGSDPYKAIAAAGGILPTVTGSTTPMPSNDLQISIRRGPELISVPLRQIAGAKQIRLENGDTVIVQQAEMIRVTVSGEVVSPGEFVVRKDTTLNAAIAKAGDARPSGTLQDVLVIRRDDVFRIDASAVANGKPVPFELKDGDLVFVGRNERTILVLGEVKKPGRYLIPDNQTLHAADGLALAEGLLPEGTLRRVFLARAGKDGRMMVVQFNLDEFLKSGILASNPKLEPGDILLFGEIKGVNISHLAQFLSSALIIDSLFRRR